MSVKRAPAVGTRRCRRFRVPPPRASLRRQAGGYRGYRRATAPALRAPGRRQRPPGREM